MRLELQIIPVFVVAAVWLLVRDRVKRGLVKRFSSTIQYDRISVPVALGLLATALLPSPLPFAEIGFLLAMAAFLAVAWPNKDFVALLLLTAGAVLVLPRLLDFLRERTVSLLVQAAVDVLLLGLACVMIKLLVRVIKEL